MFYSHLFDGYMVNHICLLCHNFFSTLDVYKNQTKDQNEHYIILTSNIIRITSPEDFLNNPHILNI
jgi:hypothetical protein